MKLRFKKTKILTILFLLFSVGIILVSNSWATISLIKPETAPQQISQGTISDIPENLPEVSRSRAPEPTTLALFGSGLLGMIISFVRATYSIAKRIFDMVASILAIIIFSPLFLLTGILIKLTSKGPVFYTQTRVGLGGKHFEIIKFRTMRVDAEKDSGPVWAKKIDSRITPIGNFLRKAHIDEIPQFVNVLKGEMSIIGPRPERPIFVQQFKKEITDYEKRLQIKPGITGLAQVWHNYDVTIQDVRKKIKYDILYIKNVCFWTDLRILFRTVRVVFTGEGAH